jgi:hypothetical protein
LWWEVIQRVQRGAANADFVLAKINRFQRNKGNELALNDRCGISGIDSHAGGSVNGQYWGAPANVIYSHWTAMHPK